FLIRAVTNHKRGRRQSSSKLFRTLLRTSFRRAANDLAHVSVAMLAHCRARGCFAASPMDSPSFARKGRGLMYRNVFGEKVSRARKKEMLRAAESGRELTAAGLPSRRDLFKRGLRTAGGMLVAKAGLSARAAYGQTVNGGTNQMCLPNNQPASPPT